ATAWIDAARHAHRQPSPDWARLSQLAAIARERLEALADAINADARRQMDGTRGAAVARMYRVLAGTVVAALLFGCVVAAWLARRVAGPITAASRAASSIVSGRLDTPIPEGGDGELGTLLAAMECMRDSLRTRASREKAEELDTRSQLAEALEVSMDGIVLTDAAGRITAVNHRASQMLPDIVLAPGEDWNRAAASLCVPDPTMAAALWHAPPAAAEVKLRGGRWLRVSRSPARGGGAVAILSDITARKAHEAALSESNRRFSAAIGNMAQGLCMVDAEGRILVCNQRFCDMFGLPPAEIMAGVLVRDGSRIAMEAARYPLDLLLQLKEDQRSLKEGSRAFSVVREGEGGAALATSYEPMSGGGWVATYADVSERRAAEERQTLLMRELDHRAKNALAVVQAALRLTPKDDAESFAQAVGGRVSALARAHTLLAKGQWSGAELRDLVWGELAPFLGSAADKRAQPRAGLDGPDVTLVPGAAQAISMALHELATNATKHGALSTQEGRVSVFWEVGGDAGLLRLLWTEAGGPPVTAPPTRRGFGSRLLEATLKDQLGGKLTREWRPGGLVCAIELPVSRALAGQPRHRPIRTGLESSFVPTGGASMASHDANTGTAAARPAGATGATAGTAATGGAATPAARRPDEAWRHARAFSG
ncbi:MAG: PAS-domain containing protein, partial [Acetobacteraceae bacterium]|nr:PAS-domain containing protein [Acetobacteraceae bacterium]